VPTYVALLRGINLGPHKKIAMPKLRELIEGLGTADVSTYVQSGNVIFRGRGGAAKLTQTIEKQIEKEFGLSVDVLLRTPAQLAKIVAANPFAKDQDDPTKLHVTFLADTPSRARARELEQGDFDPDELRVVGQEVFLHCPHGYGRSKLSNTFFEKELGVRGTTRNWRTVTKLAELAKG
jgi:uncharacterized protein (DUF1697 family)